MLLWPFNKYPGTDYETFNWEWLLKTVKHWNEYLTKFFAEPDGTMKTMLTNILTEHPEWVTTVMDGSITESKIAAPFLVMIKNMFVTPEQFGAVGDGIEDDTQAIQDAFDYLMTTKNGHGTIVLRQTYNIKGSVDLTKGNVIAENPITRKSTSFIGLGGELIKTNTGYMFTGSRQSSDYEFVNVRFYGERSLEGAINNNVFDASKLIRIKTIGCHFSNLNYIFDDQNTTDVNSNQQSNKSVADTFTYCNAVYNIRRSYDCTIQDGIIEDCNAVATIDEFGLNNINKFTIKDSVVESTSEGINLRTNGSVVSLTIKNCYFEKNGEAYIDVSGDYLYGVDISDNYFAITENLNNVCAIKANIRNMSWKVNNNTMATSNDAAVLLQQENDGNDAMCQFDGNFITGANGSLTNIRERVMNIYRTSGFVKYPDVATARITDANYPWVLSASGSCVIDDTDSITNLPEPAGTLFWMCSMPENDGCVEFFTSASNKACYTREMHNNTWLGWRFLGGPLCWYATGLHNGTVIDLPCPAPENSMLLFIPRLTSGTNINRFFPSNIISKGATQATFYEYDTSGAGSQTDQQGILMLVPYGNS